MKILMTSSGGVVREMEGWYEHGLAKELVKRGHDVTVYSSSSVMKSHDSKQQENIEGIEVRRFNPVSPMSLLHMLRGKWDLLHMHHLGYLAPISSYAAIRKKMKDIPSVFNVTGIYHDPFLVKDVNDPFLHPIKRKIQSNFPFAAPWKIPEWLAHLPLFTADEIIAMTEWERNEIAKYNINSDKIDTIPIGINLKKFRKTKTSYFRERGIEGQILLFVGQPTRRKGWQYFLNAMPRINKEFPEAKAVFIGYRRSLEMDEMIKKLKIEDSVSVFGFLPEEEKISAFQSADAFVFPTLYEGFGMVFLEAMASGLPIITTDVAGNKEIIEHGKNGFLVRPKDEKSVSDSVIKLLKNKGLQQRIRKNNREKVKLYDWKILVNKYLEAYESAIDAN